jgi:hypothetical protein
MPRSQRNDNFIDKTFTVIADILLKVLPTSQRENKLSCIIGMECRRNLPEYARHCKIMPMRFERMPMIEAYTVYMD